LPDSFTDENLRELFAKHGDIRSCKTVKKELVTSYLGIKRSLKVFGYVCYFVPEHAREAKTKLNEVVLPGTNVKLFVDYHQSKQERNDYLKLKMLNNTNRLFNKGRPDLPPMMRNLPNMRNLNTVFGPHMLRKFPPQTMFVKPPHMHPNMPQPGMFPHPMAHPMNPMQNFPPHQMPPVHIQELDKNSRRDFYGEKLYTKISINPNYSHLVEFFSKIVGIFLDLDDQVIDRLINDDAYFGQQVLETVRVKLKIFILFYFNFFNF
jgi:RNA recognition motif-containing protein